MENILKLLFLDGTCGNFFVDEKPPQLKKKLLINSVVLHCGKAPLAEIFFPFFYNIKEDTEIIIFQSNVRKIYEDPKTV